MGWENRARPELASTHRVDRLFEGERTGDREIELEEDAESAGVIHTS